MPDLIEPSSESDIVESSITLSVNNIALVSGHVKEILLQLNSAFVYHKVGLITETMGDKY